MAAEGDAGQRLDWLDQAIQDIENGRLVEIDPAVHFPGKTRPSIPAEAIAVLMTGGRLNGKQVPESTRGVSIKGVLVQGELDLSDARARNGGALGPLILEDCHFSETINLQNARLRRLILKDSRIVHLIGRNLHVEGEVDLSGLASYEETDDWRDANEGKEKSGARANARWREPDLAVHEFTVRDTPNGLCWVELQGAHVGGRFRAGKACFVAPEPRPGHRAELSPTFYALDLHAAKVCGPILLQPAVTALGGVNLGDIVADSDIWADGAVFESGEGYALRCQAANISGVLGLAFAIRSAADTTNRPFVARGGLWLVGARMTHLYLSGAQVFCGKVSRPADNADNWSLACTHMQVRGDLTMDAIPPDPAKPGDKLQPACLIGAFSLVLASIDGDLRMTNARIELPDAGPADFCLQANISVGGHFYFQECAVQGGVQLFRSTIGKDLVVNLSKQQKHNSARFDFSYVTVRGRGHINRFGVQSLDLERAVIEQDLYIVGRTGEVRCDGHVRAGNAVVHGDLHINGNIDGLHDFANLTCQGSVLLGDMTVLLPKEEADAKRVRELTRLNLQNAEVRHALKIDSMKVLRQGDPPPVKRIRSCRLPFYQPETIQADKTQSGRSQSEKGWSVVEALVETTRGLALLSLVRNDATGELIALDGASSPIHALNDRLKLRLSLDNAIDYLKFFCANVWADGGAFTIIEEGDISGLRPGPNPLDGFKLSDRSELKPPSFAAQAETPEGFRVNACVLYAKTLFSAELLVHRTGMVQMLSDKPLPVRESKSDSKGTIVFEQPVRRLENAGDHPGVFPFYPSFNRDAASWSVSEDPAELARVAKDAPQLGSLPDSGKKSLKPLPLVWINLGGARIRTLDDGNGFNWTPSIDSKNGVRPVDYSQRSLRSGRLNDLDPVRLQLQGLRYEEEGPTAATEKREDESASGERTTDKPPSRRGLFSWFGAPRSSSRGATLKFREVAPGTVRDEVRWRYRRPWLARQYRSRAVMNEYSPQPYEQLERAYARHGAYDKADSIRAHRASIELRRNARYAATLPPPVSVILWPLIMLGGFFAWLFTRFGLSALRAVLSIALFWAIGSVAVGHANRSGLLVLNSQPVYEVGTDRRIETAAREVEQPCGREISPALYALDLFVPLLDLQQETRCEFRQFDATRDAPLAADTFAGKAANVAAKLPADPRVWEWLKSIYMIIGWIIISVTIWTCTRILQRRSED